MNKTFTRPFIVLLLLFVAVSSRTVAQNVMVDGHTIYGGDPYKVYLSADKATTSVAVNNQNKYYPGQGIPEATLNGVKFQLSKQYTSPTAYYYYYVSSMQVSLAYGLNTFIYEYSQKHVSTIYINRAYPVLLSSLSVNDQQVSPVFTDGVYNVNVDTLSREVSSIKITPVSDSLKAVIRVNGVPAASGSGVDVPVKAGDNTIKVDFDVNGDSSLVVPYTVRVYRKKAYIDSLSTNLSAQLSTAFDRNVNSYTIAAAMADSVLKLKPVATDTSLILKVNDQVVTSSTESQAIPLQYGDNVIHLSTLLADSTLNNIYTLTVTRPQIDSLTSIVLSEGTLSPAFSPGVLAYTATLPLASASIKLTPIANDATAAITVNNVTVASGAASADIPLQTGDTPITLAVKSTQGSTQTYSVTIKHEGAASLLKSLTTNIQLDTAFTPTDFSYTAIVNYDVTNISLTPTAAYAGATVYINGPEGRLPLANSLPLALGNNVFTIAVTGTDLATKTYTLSITRLAGITLLTGIQLNVGTLSPVFNPLTRAYSVSVDVGHSEILVTPVAADNTAIVKVNGQLFDKNLPVNVALNQGANTITILVTKTGDIDRTYVLNINRPEVKQYVDLSGVAFVYGGDAAHNYTDAWYATVPSTTTRLTPAAVPLGYLGSGAHIGINDGPLEYKTAALNYGLTKIHLQYAVPVRYGTTTVYDFYYYVTRLKPLTINLTDQNKQISDADFVPAASSPARTITYISSNTNVAVIKESKIHITGVGTTSITATHIDDGEYDAASVTKTLTVNKTAQTIIFTGLIKTYGDADFVPATASSKLAVTYTSSNIKVATIINGKVHLIGAGTTTITATQAGNSTYTAKTATAALTVKAVQTIAFAGLAKTYGNADFDPATASSKLPLTYTSSNTKVATIVNGKVHLVGTGTTTITASQPGDAEYEAAANVTQKLTVGKGTQTITFAAATRAYNDADFSPAVASSKLALTYTSNNTKVATIVNGKVHVISPGTVTITAAQAGNTSYNAAKTVNKVLTINKAKQTIAFVNPAKTYGNADYVAATISSGLALTYTSSDKSTATIVNGKIHIVSAGATYITASHAGNANYEAASLVSHVIVSKAKQTITLATATKTYGNADYIAATVSSGLPLTFISSNKNTATIVNGKIHIAGAGATYITASQAGNANYEAASLVDHASIAKAPLTITADNKTKKAGQANPALTVTYKGFVNGDNQTDLTTPPKLTTTAITSSKAGTYAITASAAVSSNYAITYVAGKLVVSAAVATIKLNSIDEVPQPLVSQALSPNGDGSNDVLTIANIDKYPDNTLIVMDVNGNNIYEAKGYDNQNRVFDGHSTKGVMQKPGTYYYLLQYKDGDEVKKLTGYILIKY